MSNHPGVNDVSEPFIDPETGTLSVTVNADDDADPMAIMQAAYDEVAPILDTHQAQRDAAPVDVPESALAALTEALMQRSRAGDDGSCTEPGCTAPWFNEVTAQGATRTGDLVGEPITARLCISHTERLCVAGVAVADEITIVFTGGLSITF